MASCERCKYQNKQEYEEPCVGCVHDSTENYEPMTQADRIRSMTDEELANIKKVEKEIAEHYELAAKLWKEEAEAKLKELENE